MKCLKIYTMLFFLILPSYLYAESEHDHGHHNSSNLKLTLNDGKKWPTDEALRVNMEAIHGHIKERLHKIHKNQMTSEDFKDMGSKIKKNVDLIFKNCKLEPAADEQLHIILSSVLSANSSLLGKASSEEKKKSVEAILGRYKDYVGHFDHTEGNRKK